VSKIRLYFKSQAIREDGEFLCLTDMWRAAGSDENRRPVIWLRQDATQQFAEYLAAEQKVTLDHLSRAELGRNGSTWAHWQLAMAYAKYLSPEFHAWCNEVVRAVMQGQGQAPVTAPHQDVAALLREALAQFVPAVMQAVDQRIEARVSGLSFGVVRPWELGAIKRKLSAAADAAVAAKAYPSRRSALAGLTMRMRTACGWTGTGAHLNRMPASMLPYAERELAAIEREFERAGNVRQLPLGGVR